jgi:hypothetical protein
MLFAAMQNNMALSLHFLPEMFSSTPDLTPLKPTRRPSRDNVDLINRTLINPIMPPQFPTVHGRE